MMTVVLAMVAALQGLYVNGRDGDDVDDKEEDEDNDDDDSAALVLFRITYTGVDGNIAFRGPMASDFGVL